MLGAVCGAVGKRQIAWGLALFLMGPGVVFGQAPIPAATSDEIRSGSGENGSGEVLSAPTRVDSLPVTSLSQRQEAFEVFPESRRYRPRRLWWGVGGATVLNLGGMATLYQFWYSNTKQTRWHWYDQPGGRPWYDDWFTYVQQDKLGHLYSSWKLTRLGIAYGRWSGLSDRKAVLLGMGASTLFQSQIEFFDGFAAIYGASRTDLLANVAGSALAGAQYLYPDRTNWFTLKYSYHPSPYYDPSRGLGNAIQDYQGITFWLSLRPDRLLPGQMQPYWPDGLALSVGHSGTGLERAVSGFDDSPEHRRQLFLGPDVMLGELIDLPRSLRPLERVLSFVRLPLPALQVAPHTQWRWVYF